MILTTSELIATLQQEVSILLHLAGKVEGSMLSYRPTPKQRSTLELLQYMAIMGPTQLTATGARLRTQLLRQMTGGPLPLSRLSLNQQRTLVKILEALVDEKST